MLSVSDNQLRIVAEAADLLPAEARGTFLRRVVAEVREGRSFKDSDIERAVRVALFDQPMKQASVSSTDQGGGKLRSDTPTDSQEALASHPFAAFLTQYGTCKDAARRRAQPTARTPRRLRGGQMQFQKRPGAMARANSPRLDTTEQVASIRLGTK